MSRLASAFLLFLGACASLGHGSADLVLENGKIVTVDDDLGQVEALAVRNGKVLAVGTSEEIRALVGPGTRVIDLGGRLAIPGFIEGHGHFVSLGVSRQILDLGRVESWDDIVAMVEAAVARAGPGEWIEGRGWHQEKWTHPPANAVEGFPTHRSLSAVSPDNPVCLRHASGHACLYNAKAMELAGIVATTPDPSGGEILRDAAGEATGVFIETAQGLVDVPSGGRAEIERAARIADEECSSKGVTSFQDAGSSFEVIDVLREMAEHGELSTRLWVMIREPNKRLAGKLDAYRMEGVGDEHLTVHAIKRVMDGALGSRGAWLLQPYSDLPDSSGLATTTVDDLAETARLAAAHGYQLCVHAIGDRANREVLDVFEQTFAANPDMKDPRWRVEHAQHLNPADIPRFASLGVIASMQGVHCTSDAPFVVERLGETRAREGAYVWAKLLASGALVTNGTDTPVEDVDPIACYYATVTRRLADGETFFPDQCMTRMQALRAYTIDCAKAAFEEDVKGSLTPGKLADVVVLSKDILTVPADEIPEAKVDYTIVGGTVAYERR